MAKVGHATTKGHVLIVEDEIGILSALALLLEMEDYSTTQATDGRQGLAAVAASRPDVIVTDFMMPWMSGTEMIRRLREDPQYRDIPIILISAVAAKDTGAEELIDAYLRKPPNVDRLCELVAVAVEQGREGLRRRFS